MLTKDILSSTDLLRFFNLTQRGVTFGTSNRFLWLIELYQYTAAEEECDKVLLAVRREFNASLFGNREVCQFYQASKTEYVVTTGNSRKLFYLLRATCHSMRNVAIIEDRLVQRRTV